MIYALSIATAIYLVFAFIWDIKERAIYSFPCEVLIVLWTVYLAMSGKVSLLFFLGYVVVDGLIFFVLKSRSIWGDGDSELLLLFMQVYLAFCHHYSIKEICFELLTLASALIIAILVSGVEAKLRSERFCMNRSVAVAPGFAIVIITLMVKGVIIC